MDDQTQNPNPAQPVVDPAVVSVPTPVLPAVSEPIIVPGNVPVSPEPSQGGPVQPEMPTPMPEPAVPTPAPMTEPAVPIPVPEPTVPGGMPTVPTGNPTGGQPGGQGVV